MVPSLALRSSSASNTASAASTSATDAACQLCGGGGASWLGQPPISKRQLCTRWFVPSAEPDGSNPDGRSSDVVFEDAPTPQEAALGQKPEDVVEARWQPDDSWQRVETTRTSRPSSYASRVSILDA